MKAFVKTRYGGPEVLRLEEVEMPVLKDDQVLVKVLANSANPADWHILRGKPFFARFSFGLFRPKNKIAGADFAGIVLETGKNVSQFKVGDRVFGESVKEAPLQNISLLRKVFVLICPMMAVSPKWLVCL